VPPLLIGGAISAGTSLIGGLLGQSAASKAAAAQAAANAKAGQVVGAAGQQAVNAQTGQIAQERTTEQPYTNLGAGTATTLSNDLAPGGALTQGYSSFSAPTGVNESNDPGYAFRLQQGQNALQNSAAARGGLLSTGTAKALTDYGQGAASAEYGNVYNRALQTYGTNFNTFNTGQNNLYSRLYGATALGANAATSLNNVTQSGTANLTGDIMSTGQQQAGLIAGTGTAQAGGIVGGSNALTAGIGGVGNAIGQGLTLQSILGARNASNTSAPTVAPTDPYNTSNGGWSGVNS
jgi:hypothetical protein